MSVKPMRLLQKYDILLDHLDFEYIRQCSNGRELENILKVLRSGEEGHFPQLTAFAEERLRAVRPDSKLLRKEQPLATPYTLPDEQWSTISSQLQQWQDEMKQLGAGLRARAMAEEEEQDHLPPIRQVTSESQSADGGITKSKKPVERIRSCDYDKWDQYDPEAEMLKMDLDEERHREFVLLQNQKNAAAFAVAPKIIELTPEPKLSEQEKLILAGKSREKGNDFFRAKEYSEAAEEYGKSLNILPTATCFNNRAMAYIKLHRYKEAIADCDQCLSREPGNVKALLRKGQALLASDNRREAYRVFCGALKLEPGNKVALSNTAQLRNQLPDLPPPNAVRMTIEEVSSSTASAGEIDFGALIKPKRLIKDRLPDALKRLQMDPGSFIRQAAEREEAEEPVITLDINRPSSHQHRRRPLIEEL
ncbi:sperm-associated antigen 1-like [Anopheles albimanus]|uniref:Sperm-associated antigen 1 n=1 Tax=Anopheles albimanus TaxID=7167 RepID=A0A8W7K9Y0_ANOAL|nr:sperm-associated antigen 1-like [Anopheles albimanus]